MQMHETCVESRWCIGEGVEQNKELALSILQRIEDFEQKQ